DFNRELRIGGLGKQGSGKHLADGRISFTITDLGAEVKVTYKGFVPALFREGQGVVAQGVIDAKGRVQARAILATPDENYMPREVVEQLKKSGQWKGTP